MTWIAAPALAVGLLMLGGCGKGADAPASTTEVSSSGDVTSADGAVTQSTTATTETVATTNDVHDDTVKNH
jgi:hypothetical protein